MKITSIAHIACIAFMMASCAKTYVQVVDVESTNLQKGNGKNYTYQDANCKVTYNFWSKGGSTGFTIENLTDGIMYVDLAKSFYIQNGYSHDYYLARTQSASSSYSSSIGHYASKTIYGTWGNPFSSGNRYPGSLSYQTAVVSSVGTSSGVSYIEKPIIAIPPHISKHFSEYGITKDILQDCSVKLKVKNGKKDGITYSSQESPLHFSNYITYSTDADSTEVSFSNDFYISGFTNYCTKDAYKATSKGCKKSIIVTINKYANASSFYVNYDSKHSRDYSADAQAAFGSSTNEQPANAKYSSRKYSYFE